MAEPIQLPAVAPARRSSHLAIRLARRHPLGVIGAALLALIVLSAVFAPLIASHDPSAQSLSERFQGVSTAHWLGTDDFGRDQFARLLYGARLSLLGGAYAVLVGVLVGAPLGLIAGRARGRVDAVIRSVFDSLMSIPAILLAVALVTALGPGLLSAMTAVGIVLSPRFFRMQRATTIGLSGSAYIEAAIAAGCSEFRIAVRHIVPNTLSPLLVQVSVSLGIAVLAEASISFIGLGVQQPNASWGTMLRTGYRFLEAAPYLSIPPGIAMALTVLAISWVGDALSDALRPH